MPEDIDFSKAIENLKDMLSSDEGESQIQNILGMLASGGGSEERPNEASAESTNEGENILSGLGDIQNILKIKNMLGSMENQKNNSEAEFLCALKPFLSKNRQAKLENAQKILSMTKAFKVLKDLGIGGV